MLNLVAIQEYSRDVEQNKKRKYHTRQMKMYKYTKNICQTRSKRAFRCQRTCDNEKLCVCVRLNLNVDCGVCIE